VGQTTGHDVAGEAIAAAPAAPPLIRIDGRNDSAGQNGPLLFWALAGHDEAELIKAAEGGQVSGVEPCIGARHDLHPHL